MGSGFSEKGLKSCSPINHPVHKSPVGLSDISRQLFWAVVVRLGLLVFSIWQERSRWPDGQLRFTDVDYDVFSDAALAMKEGQNIYSSCLTYRYSPLIALILLPQHHLSDFIQQSGFVAAGSLLTLLTPLLGKMFFIAMDVVCACLQGQIMLHELKDYAARSCQMYDHDSARRAISWLVGVGWLFNPLTMTVSVRGNAEAAIGVTVLACLYSLLQEYTLVAGLFFGLAVHLKMYPIIYAPLVYLLLHDRGLEPSKGAIPRLSALLVPNASHLVFALGGGLSFGTLTYAAFSVYGWQFLQRAYFYHFRRVDFWHNFAPHFYPTYLMEAQIWVNQQWASSHTLLHPKNIDPSGFIFPLTLLPTSCISFLYSPNSLKVMYAVFKLFSFLPAAILIPVLSYRLRYHVSFAWFAVTFAFVTFNQVCTSQYFLWWFVLVPPAFAHLWRPLVSREPPRGSACLQLKTPTHRFCPATGLRLTSLWFLGQAAWLGLAYLQEMRSELWGRGLWLALWTASLQCLLINVFTLRRLITCLPNPPTAEMKPASSLNRSPLGHLDMAPGFLGATDSDATLHHRRPQHY